MKFEMRRKIDEFGRIVVPQDIRDYYGIGDGDTVVLIPIKEGIQVVKTEPFLVGQLPRSITATVDGNGRMVVPAFFRNYYRFSLHAILQCFYGYIKINIFSAGKNIHRRIIMFRPGMHGKMRFRNYNNSADSLRFKFMK